MNKIEGFKKLKIILILIIGIVLFFVGLLLGNINQINKEPIIIQWIDSKYGKKFYGVQIFTAKTKNKYIVKSKILISPHQGIIKYIHDLGIIGKENNLMEVTEKYSDIKVKLYEDERFLFIGDKPILKISELEQHR